MSAAGALAGVALAAAGAGVFALAPGAMLPLAVALGAVALAYALHELGFIHLPAISRDWQVPASWVRHGFYRSAIVFGGTVGFGVFTRIPYASLPVLFAWFFVSGNVWYGLAAGLTYGVARALSIYLGANSKETGDLVDLNHRIMSMIPALHQVTGAALAAFAAYLLVAPNL
jgi:hypothetical protein